MFKSGFVAVIGRSNVGKSTFLNKVIGEKISIISNKPQTTRNRIQMIYTDNDMQVIFLDTPGIQMPKNKLGEYMLKISKESLSDVDLVTYIVDTSTTIGPIESEIIKDLRKIKTPIILLINKIDTANDEIIEEVVKIYEELDLFKKIIPISALEGTNLDKYFETINELLPEGPMYFPDDMITDQPERQIVSEIIREKALINLDDELPHGITVIIEKMKDRPNKNIMDISATIIVEKKSHKGMVIGKGGKMIKKIGMTARNDIERLLDTRVNLQLWVKIDEDWRSKDSKLRNFGFK
ncbi:MAG: GTPase Era [Tissierellia bacterium]|nr:GTPase Era [Tissierellia bacterium]